jgi:hypothetical protein
MTGAAYDGTQTAETLRVEFLRLQEKVLSGHDAAASAELQTKFGGGPHWFLKPNDSSGPSTNKRRRGWATCGLTFGPQHQAKFIGPSARHFGRGVFTDDLFNRYNRGRADNEMFVKLTNTRGLDRPQAGQTLTLTPVKTAGVPQDELQVVVKAAYFVSQRQTGVVKIGETLDWEQYSTAEK